MSEFLHGMIYVAIIVVIILLAFLANGMIAEVEDDSPGGFNNPNGKWIDVLKNPKPHQVVIWVLGIIVIGVFIIYPIICKYFKINI